MSSPASSSLNPSAARSSGPIAAGAVVLAVILVIAAGAAWARATPPLGERPLSASHIWTARCGAVALWAAGQAALFGVALPMIYRGRLSFRARPAYAGLAALSGMIAAMAGISAAALAAG